MYVVETGEFEVIQWRRQSQIYKTRHDRWRAGALYQAPRAADVRCVKEPAKLWKLKREVFVKFNLLDSKRRAHSNIEKLSKVDMLKDLSPSQLNSISKNGISESNFEEFRFWQRKDQAYMGDQSIFSDF